MDAFSKLNKIEIDKLRSRSKTLLITAELNFPTITWVARYNDLNVSEIPFSQIIFPTVQQQLFGILGRRILKVEASLVIVGLSGPSGSETNYYDPTKTLAFIVNDLTGVRTPLSKVNLNGTVVFTENTFLGFSGTLLLNKAPNYLITDVSTYRTSVSCSIEYL